MLHAQHGTPALRQVLVLAKGRWLVVSLSTIRSSSGTYSCTTGSHLDKKAGQQVTRGMHNLGPLSADWHFRHCPDKARRARRTSLWTC